MEKIIEIIRYLLGIPKSIYFNFKYFPVKIAIKFPVIVSHRVKLRKLSGTIKLEKIKCGMVRIGFGSLECYDFKYTPAIFRNTGEIIFKGKCKIGYGSVISNEGKITFGENVNITKTSIICREKIEIGKECLFGWDCLIMDTDHHHIYDSQNLKNKINGNREIYIGDHVWLGAKVTVLKGAEIPKDNIVAIGTTVNQKILKSNMIIANDLKIRIVKENIYWKE